MAVDLNLPSIDIMKYEDAIARARLYKETGKVLQVVGLLIEGYIPGVQLGSICSIQSSDGYKNMLAEVVGFRDKRVLLMALQEMEGIGIGSRIHMYQRNPRVKVDDSFLGRIMDGSGFALDNKGELDGNEHISLYRQSMNPIDRALIREPLDLGIRSINAAMTLGKGQRIGIMAGSGVGKSVLMGMMARSSNADVNVIALIGERGREVREFIESDLGEEGLKRSVVVVSTSDRSPLLRLRGAYYAMSIAEYFRDQGKDVLFLMDSVTRFAMAQREIGLTIGEPPATKGYTPSVFAALPKLLERAGAKESAGSITGIFTVLVEGDDMDDPIGDAVRSVVDGHIVLSRAFAHRNHYPAVDVLASTSRCMNSVVSKEHQHLAYQLRELLAVYKEAEDLINVGAYAKGSNPKIDRAIQKIDEINQFLRQSIDEKFSLENTLMSMRNILKG